MPEHTIAGIEDRDERSDATVAMHESFTTFTMTPDWLLDHPGISGEAFRVWAIICSYAGKERTAFPGVATLAVRLHKSKRSIFNYLNELEDAGALQRQQRYRDDGGRTSTLYTLAWAHPLHGSPVSSMAPPPATDDMGAHEAGCTPPHEAGCTPITRSSVELDPKEQNPLTPIGGHSPAAPQAGRGGETPPRTPAPFSASAQHRTTPRASGTNPRALAKSAEEIEAREKQLERAHARGFDYCRMLDEPPYETAEEYREMLQRESLRHHRKIDLDVMEAEVAGYAAAMVKAGVL